MYFFEATLSPTRTIAGAETVRRRRRGCPPGTRRRRRWAASPVCACSSSRCPPWSGRRTGSSASRSGARDRLAAFGLRSTPAPASSTTTAPGTPRPSAIRAHRWPSQASPSASSSMGGADLPDPGRAPARRPGGSPAASASPSTPPSATGRGGPPPREGARPGDPRLDRRRRHPHRRRRPHRLHEPGGREAHRLGHRERPRPAGLRGLPDHRRGDAEAPVRPGQALPGGEAGRRVPRARAPHLLRRQGVLRPRLGGAHPRPRRRRLSAPSWSSRTSPSSAAWSAR